MHQLSVTLKLFWNAFISRTLSLQFNHMGQCPSYNTEKPTTTQPQAEQLDKELAMQQLPSGLIQRLASQLQDLVA